MRAHFYGFEKSSMKTSNLQTGLCNMTLNSLALQPPICLQQQVLLIILSAHHPLNCQDCSAWAHALGLLALLPRCCDLACCCAPWRLWLLLAKLLLAGSAACEASAISTSPSAAGSAAAHGPFQRKLLLQLLLVEIGVSGAAGTGFKQSNGVVLEPVVQYLQASPLRPWL